MTKKDPHDSIVMNKKDDEEEEIEEAEKALKDLQELIGEDDPELKRAEIQIGYLKEDDEKNYKKK